MNKLFVNLSLLLVKFVFSLCSGSGFVVLVLLVVLFLFWL